MSLNLDFAPAATLCRDDRCPRLGVHLRHNLGPTPARLTVRRALRVDDGVWVCPKACARPAIQDCVLAAITMRVCRSSSQIHALVVDNYGEITLRAVQRSLRVLVAEYEVAYCTPDEPFVGAIGSYRGVGGYLRAASPLLKTPDGYTTIREQIFDLMVEPCRPIPLAARAS